MTLQERMHKRRAERAQQVRKILAREDLEKAIAARNKKKADQLAREARIVAEANTPAKRAAERLRAAKSKDAKYARERGENESETFARHTAEQRHRRARTRRLRHTREAQETQVETEARRASERERAAKVRNTKRGLQKPQTPRETLAKQDKTLSLKLRQLGVKRANSASLEQHKELLRQEVVLRGEITLVRTQLRQLNGEA